MSAESWPGVFVGSSIQTEMRPMLTMASVINHATNRRRSRVSADGRPRITAGWRGWSGGIGGEVEAAFPGVGEVLGVLVPAALGADGGVGEGVEAVEAGAGCLAEGAADAGVAEEEPEQGGDGEGLDGEGGEKEALGWPAAEGNGDLEEQGDEDAEGGEGVGDGPACDDAGGGVFDGGIGHGFHHLQWPSTLTPSTAGFCSRPHAAKSTDMGVFAPSWRLFALSI